MDLDSENDVYGLVDPRNGDIVLVTSSMDAKHSVKKYQGDLKRMVGSPSVYRFLCELRSEGFSVDMVVLERCESSIVNSTKKKWIKDLKQKGQAFLNP